MGHIAQPLIILGAASCELLEYTLMDYANFFFLRARDCVVPFNLAEIRWSVPKM